MSKVIQRLGLPLENVTNVTAQRLTELMARVYQEQMAPALKEVDLNPTSWKTLMMFFKAEGEPLNPSDLATITGESRTNMTRICDELVARGFITRFPSQDDRRRIDLKMSEAGAEMIRKTAPDLRKHLEPVHSALTEEEKKLLIALLKKQLASMLD
ncbi:MarR family transcriptional regulator [Leeia sp. TBRC 13508]|uniref:MarR family transcriptional regulator n=1 Tax=Leeia speluncae TaxID=2884804 RepID=A0ABS8D3T8_9NEIS|nr:MarR family transcriptional regulator [Leeia speluncae]MCB6182839.1 MarR family transcriptional regulator [Leeia speluncae]